MAAAAGSASGAATEGALGPDVIYKYEPTYRLKPAEDDKFRPSVVKAICKEVVDGFLKEREWKGDEETVWTRTLADEIRTRVKALGLPRYKFVVQVSLGEVRGQGVRVASRCLWDTDTDNHASYSFRSDSVWCSVMVFGLYAE